MDFGVVVDFRFPFTGMDPHRFFHFFFHGRGFDLEVPGSSVSIPGEIECMSYAAGVYECYKKSGSGSGSMKLIIGRPVGGSGVGS